MSAENLRAALTRADDAYTLAVQRAAGGGDWGHAREARRAVHEAASALKAAGYEP